MGGDASPERTVQGVGRSPAVVAAPYHLINQRDGERGTVVELRRSRVSWWPVAVLLAFGVLMLLTRHFVVAGLVVAAGCWAAVARLRPFRFQIGADGLTLRWRGINRLVPWQEIEELVLDEPSRSAGPQLILAPTTRAGLPAPLRRRTPATDRPGALILKFSEVQDTPDAVAAALSRDGGARFTDYRPVRRLAPAAAEFTVVLRGYDRPRVDQVVSGAQGALSAGGDASRRQAWAELAAARATLTVVARGYDRIQVDELLDQLAADLARPE